MNRHHQNFKKESNVRSYRTSEKIPATRRPVFTLKSSKMNEENLNGSYTSEKTKSFGEITPKRLFTKNSLKIHSPIGSDLVPTAKSKETMASSNHMVFSNITNGIKSSYSTRASYHTGEEEPKFRFCIVCESPILETNIFEHENRCPGFASLYDKSVG